MASPSDRSQTPASERRGAAGSTGRTGAVAAGQHSTRAVYVISVAAELAGVHPQTLRIYERRGLLDPARTGGGSRRYSEADIDHLRRIQELTADGVNLEGVKRILELETELEALRAQLEAVRREAAEALASTHRQYRRDLVPVRNIRLPAKWRPEPPTHSLNETSTTDTR